MTALLVLTLAISLQLLLPRPTEAASLHLELNSSAPSSPSSLKLPSLERKQTTTYYQVDEFSGSTFFDNFDVFNGPDPTHGAVNYVGVDESWRRGLIYIGQDGLPVMQTDSWTSLPYGTNRDSVRITTKKIYDGGLFILDFAWIPWGCSIWPAVWTFGADWPNTGEIDVLEGVNLQTTKTMVVHSAEGCYLLNPGVFSGTAGNTDCSHKFTTSGCQIYDNAAVGSTYGNGFNAQGGGVWALLWDGDGIKIWSFPASSIPTNIRSRTPDPTTWGVPNGAWAPTSCDPYKYFTKHRLVLDITICGDWAGDGSAYPSSGCPGTCLEQVMNPAVYAASRFKINSIRTYTASGLSSTVLGLGTTYNSSIIRAPANGSTSTSGAASELSNGQPAEEGGGRAQPRTTSVKVCVIGDSGVGKTSLRNKYISKRFSQSYKATIGCDFVSHTIPISEEENVSLAIWDTAGQERFASLSSAFFRSSDAAIFVYDRTNPRSLQNIKRWFGEFVDRCPVQGIEGKRRFCFVVVGNKADKLGGEGSREEGVKEEDVRALLDQLVPPRPSPPPPPPPDPPTLRSLPSSNSFSSNLATATSRLRTLSSSAKRSSSPAPSSRSGTITLLPSSSSPASHSIEILSSSASNRDLSSSASNRESPTGTMANTFTPTLYHTPSSSFFETYGTQLMNDRNPPPSSSQGTTQPASPSRAATSSMYSFNTARTSSTSTVTFPSEPSSSRQGRGASVASSASSSNLHTRNRSLSAHGAKSISSNTSNTTLRPTRTSLLSNASASNPNPPQSQSLPPPPPPIPPPPPPEMPKIFFEVSAKTGEGVAEVFELRDELC
ncbi:hypothetical protein BDY24DRAFT_443256 [Mrakia frigida]|uniref:uncharacterized protein n=1 Tax=Mrakia frigida TaxID=29902 RepID=UPI003FCC22EE